MISVPLHTLGRKCTECWIEVYLCVQSNHDLFHDTAGPIPSNLTTLMRTWLTFTAHSRDHSIECRWTGDTQSLYYSTKLAKMCAKDSIEVYLSICTWTRTHCRLPLLLSWHLCWMLHRWTGPFNSHTSMHTWLEVC